MSFPITFVTVSQNFCDSEISNFLPFYIRILKSDFVETCETQKSGNEILSHCLNME